MKAVALGRGVLLGGCLGVFGLVGLTGCGVATSDMAAPGRVAGAAIKGNVHGGQQPVTGAQVYLLAASTDGYTQPSSNLLITPEPTSGLNDYPYVTTDGAGNFSITGDYGCAPGQPVYLLVLYGNPGIPGVTNNPALALMAALGPCPAGGTFPSSSFVEVNEVTTVAAVYALSGFLFGPVNLAIPNENLAATGIMNAVNNAGQLVDLTTGTALTTTPNGAGAVPTATINTLANIIASCVNSDGSLTQTVDSVTSNTACGNLFEYTKVGSEGPTETVTALLNIAHNPAANVAGLFGLASKTSPFLGLTTQPNDFTLSIGYSTSYLTNNEAGTTATAGVPAVDASGNVWFPVTALVPASTYVATLQGLSPLGAQIGGEYIGFSEGGLSFLPEPMQAAVDPSGNVWTAVNNSGSVYEYFPSLDTVTAYNYNSGTNDDGHEFAFDASGNLYVSDYTNGKIYKLDGSGTAQSFTEPPSGVTYAGLGFTDLGFIATGLNTGSGTTAVHEVKNDGSEPNLLTYPEATSNVSVAGGVNSFAADSNFNVWITSPGNTLSSYYEKDSHMGQANSYDGGGLQANTAAWPIIWAATDGGGNVWVSNYGTSTIAGNISEFDNNGNAISPATGFLAQTACPAQGLAIDGSGDVWVGCANPTTPVLEYIGAAVPVYTPLTPGSMGIMP